MSAGAQDNVNYAERYSSGHEGEDTNAEEVGLATQFCQEDMATATGSIQPLPTVETDSQDIIEVSRIPFRPPYYVESEYPFKLTLMKPAAKVCKTHRSAPNMVNPPPDTRPSTASISEVSSGVSFSQLPSHENSDADFYNENETSMDAAAAMSIGEVELKPSPEVDSELLPLIDLGVLQAQEPAVDNLPDQESFISLFKRSDRARGAESEVSRGSIGQSIATIESREADPPSNPEEEQENVQSQDPNLESFHDQGASHEVESTESSASKRGEEDDDEDTCDYFLDPEDYEKTHISCWYQKFQRKTQKTIIIPVPPNVLEYLKSYGCNLPNNTETSAMNSIPRSSSNDSLMSSSYSSEASIEERNPFQEDSSSSESDNEECDDLPNGANAKPSPIQRTSFDKFDEFDDEVTTAIKALGGSVHAKLNWKSAKDAVWIGFNKSLRCFVPGDIYLLFKASNYITDVLTEPYKGCTNFDGVPLPPCLVLRKWIDISPAGEFRCFVVENLLVGICQRDTSGHYPSIYDEKDLIIEDIHCFYREILFEEVGLTHFVFDVVRHGRKNVKLIDINVFGLVTDSMLYTYDTLNRIYEDNLADGIFKDDDEEEFEEKCQRAIEKGRRPPSRLPSYDSLPNVGTFGDPLFRFVESPNTIKAHPYLSSGAPHDLRLKLQLPVKNPRTPLIQDPFLENASGYTGI